jgi:hypothetical protein
MFEKKGMTHQVFFYGNAGKSALLDQPLVKLVHATRNNWLKTLPLDRQGLSHQEQGH